MGIWTPHYIKRNNLYPSLILFPANTAATMAIKVLESVRHGGFESCQFYKTRLTLFAISFCELRLEQHLQFKISIYIGNGAWNLVKHYVLVKAPPCLVLYLPFDSLLMLIMPVVLGKSSALTGLKFDLQNKPGVRHFQHYFECSCIIAAIFMLYYLASFVCGIQITSGTFELVWYYILNIVNNHRLLFKSASTLLHVLSGPLNVHTCR